MGTNYYLHDENLCTVCDRSDPPLHIGKSSGGWCFGLHVIPDEGLTTLDAWERRWAHGQIRNEYGDTILPEDMRRIVCNRQGKPFSYETWFGYRNESHFHASNHSERGPQGLLRHHIDGQHCIGHGDGTWDYIAGEFS